MASFTLTGNGEWRSGSAPALGAGGRGFKSPLPDRSGPVDSDVSRVCRKRAKVTEVVAEHVTAWLCDRDDESIDGRALLGLGTE